MAQLPARVPTPPDRPYRLGEGAREVPAAYAARVQTVELAAATRPEPPVVRASLPDRRTGGFAGFRLCPDAL